MEKQIRQTYFEGERPLFGAEHLSIQDTIFGEGESPLKESRDISLEGSISSGNIRSGTVRILR